MLQGSVLHPLSIYLNDLPDTMDYSEVALYADVVMYFSNAETALVQANINSELTLLPIGTANSGLISEPKCQSMVLAAVKGIEGVNEIPA